MHATAPVPAWHTIAILFARLIFAAVFLMGTVFKFTGMTDTADYIAAADSRSRSFSPGLPPSSSSCW